MIRHILCFLFLIAAFVVLLPLGIAALLKSDDDLSGK